MSDVTSLSAYGSALMFAVLFWLKCFPRSYFQQMYLSRFLGT